MREKGKYWLRLLHDIASENNLRQARQRFPLRGPTSEDKALTRTLKPSETVARGQGKLCGRTRDNQVSENIHRVIF